MKDAPTSHHPGTQGTKIAIGVIISAIALYAAYRYNYLLFHVLAEMFSIIIACGIFMLVWNSRRYFDNHFLFFIGIAYLFIGALDLTHTLVYKGMAILPGYDANAPTQLWIAARYLESITLLVGPLMLNRRIRPALIAWGYAVVTALLLLSILYWRIFPDCYIDRAGGLTPFKIISEYIISLILVVGAALVFRLRSHLTPDVLRWLLASYGLKLLSELAFSNYVSVYGPANMLGHMLKIASFYCVYKAVIETGLTKPYDLMFKNLGESRERYRSLFVHMIDGYASHRIILDHEGQPVDYRFLEVNDAFLRLTGLGDVAGKRATEVIPGIKNDPAQWIKVYGEVATTGRSIRFENFAERLGRWYSVTAYSPAKDEFVTIFEDITQRKQAETELRRQREWLHVSLNSIGDAVIATDANQCVAFINPVACGLTGWTADDAVGQPIGAVFQTMDEITGGPGEDIVGRVLSTGKVVRLANHTALVSREGRSMPIQDSAAPIRNDVGDIIGVVLVFHDVSEQRKARKALEANQARLKLLSDTAGGLLAMKKPKAIVSDICRRVMDHLDCQVFFNFLSEAETGRLRLWAWGGVSVEDADKFDTADAATAICSYVAQHRERIVIENIAGTREKRTDLIRSFGVQAYCCHPLIVEDRLLGTLSFGSRTRSHFKEDDIELMRIVTDQVAIALERDQAQQTLRNINVALEDKVRQRTATLAQMVDNLESEIELREHAEADLSKANQELAEQAAQLRSLAGELTMAEHRERKRLSQVLHDGLQQYLAAAKLQLSSLSHRNVSQHIQKTVQDIEAILNESIAISRSLSAELSPPVLYEGGLPAGLEWLARWLGENHAFTLELALTCTPVLPEDVKILVFESIRELTFNAIKHAGVSRALLLMRPTDSGATRIEVSDEGAGFDTTKLKYGSVDGGGFGLWSIQERIHLIGGSFDIESTPGKGSCFSITIPPSPESAPPPIQEIAPAAAGQSHRDPNGSALQVLIVDDHALFRDGIARVVDREADMVVVGQAHDGLEAVSMAGELNPDVILMDISMPGLNGIEATRRIHEALPHICIIGLSMHEGEDHARAMCDAGAAAYQNKGCRAAELVETIRSCHTNLADRGAEQEG